MQIFKEAGPLTDCFTIHYEEHGRMALWFVISRLVLQFVRQTGDLVLPVSPSMGDLSCWKELEPFYDN